MKNLNGYKNGDKFILTKEHAVFAGGEILTLCDNDGSYQPWFCLPDDYFPGGRHHNCKGEPYWPVTLDKIEPYQEKKELKELPNTVVLCKTRREYEELREICDGKIEIQQSFIPSNPWSEERYKDNVCIKVYGSPGWCEKSWFEGEGCRIISLQEFKSIQGLETRKCAYCENPVAKPMSVNPICYKTIVTRSFKVEEKQKKKGGIMRQLTARLKKALNKNLQAMYKLGWIDGDLELTEAGSCHLQELLLDLHEEEMGKLALAKIAELEKEEKKK